MARVDQADRVVGGGRRGLLSHHHADVRLFGIGERRMLVHVAPDADLHLIAGAVRLGWDSALVLTGATRREEIDGSPWRPTVVLDDVSGLL